MRHPWATGDLPDAREISNHLLNVPRFFDLPAGGPYYTAVRGIVAHITQDAPAEGRKRAGTFDFSDEEREEVIAFIDTLDERVFSTTKKQAWKLRMYFKPSDVVGFLVSRGITHRLFSASS